MESEDLCLSSIFNNKTKKYCFGIDQQKGLILDGKWLLSFSENVDSGVQYILFNMTTKVIMIGRKDRKDSVFIFDDDSDKQCNSVIDLANDGMRWEGPILNNLPFGYGSLYNKSNDLIYRGVMVGNKKECFGSEFFSGFNGIEYRGCYWNNQRHGYGMLYDCKGKLVYEGDFLVGSNDYEVCFIVDVWNRTSHIHTLIRELVVGERCGGEFKDDLKLCDYPYLESIQVMRNSCSNVESLLISNDPVLKSIIIEKGGFGSGAFEKVKRVVISSLV